MMLSMISNRCGQDVAASVTDELIHHRMRNANERQRMELRARLGVANQRVLAVVATMEQNIEEPLSCSELATHVGFSARQLERLFQKYIGQAPTRYYLGLRLERARHLRVCLGIAFFQMLQRALQTDAVRGALRAAAAKPACGPDGVSRG